jgi:hypothetical protein
VLSTSPDEALFVVLDVSCCVLYKLQFGGKMNPSTATCLHVSYRVILQLNMALSVGGSGVQ